MTTKGNLIAAGIICLLLLINKIRIRLQKKEYAKKELYHKSQKIVIILVLLSIGTFIISLLINVYRYGNETSWYTTITYLINACSIALLVYPMTLSTLYKTSFEEEEKISHIQTVVTNKSDKKWIKKLNQAGINVILLSQDSSLKMKTIKEEEIQLKDIKKNIRIQTDNLKIIDHLVDKETTYFEFISLEKFYHQLYKARGTHDNYIRTVKYLILIYLPLLISYFFLNGIGFPITYNILTVILLKGLTFLTCEYVYKYLPYDTDIMQRNPKPRDRWMSKQEWLFTCIESCCIFFALDIPYMFVFVENGASEFANTIYYTIFLYTSIFITFSHLSDANLLKNIIKSYKNIRLILFVLLNILLTIFINNTTYLNTTQIGLHNYISCICFGVIAIIMNELIKLARFTTTKGKKKNGSKNNKKATRSKFNHA